MRKGCEKSRKGASSILVILLLVVLVVFGIAALTTALSNVRLGQKTAYWNDKYYTAEAKANKVYAEIDKAVASCFDETANLENLETSIKQLDYDIEIDNGDSDLVTFSYKAWEEDVGISVILSYDIYNSSFTIKQFKAVQK